MIRNFVVVALRNIRRNIGYSAINLAGLALGMTCALVLFLMIAHLVSFDGYHPHKDRLFRIVTAADHNGRLDHQAGVPVPLPEAVKSDISGVASVLLVSAQSPLIVVEQNGNKDLYEESVAFTDAAYLRFFSRRLLTGTGSLNEPNQAVLSKRYATMFFGTEEVVGKVIRVGGLHDVAITGVMDNYPENTSFPFDILVSFATIKDEKEAQGWGSVYSDDQCYLILEDGVNPSSVNAQFPAFIEKHQGKETAEAMQRWLQPLADIHHDDRFGNFASRTVPVEYLWSLGIVALFLVVTASINFVNLSTAVAVKRSKEVGVRKVLGSQRAQLIAQYLTETGLLAALALLISTGLAEVALLKLNPFLDLNLHIDLTSPSVVAFLLGIWIVVTLSAGLYPAFLLSGYNPSVVLKNKMSNRASGAYFLRRALVVIQFVISQFLVIGTVIMLSQMEYFQSKDLGFNRESVVTVPIPDSSDPQSKVTLKNEVERIAGVEQASLCYTPPSHGAVSVTDFQISGAEDRHLTQIKMTDEEYLSLFDMHLLAGKGLTPGDSATTVVVNEKLLQVAGIENPEDALGRVLNVWDKDLVVAGVVKDFHTVSLEREIDPTVMFNDLGGYRALAIKLGAGTPTSVLDEIKKVWKHMYPDHLYRHEFVDEQIENFYRGTRKMSVLLIVFSSLAIFIGCLGLYGLMSFMAHQKEKEIGIRKVLGASVQQILLIFSREFAGLIVVAFFLASPLAGFLMKKWLSNFAYQIPLHWSMFMTGIGLTIVVALLSVGYRSFRAARTNPADVLRSD